MSNLQKCLVKMIRYSDYNGTIAAIKQFSNLIETIVKKEQKPEWSEKDNDMFDAIEACYKLNRPLQSEHFNWLKSLKERMKVE